MFLRIRVARLLTLVAVLVLAICGLGAGTALASSVPVFSARFGGEVNETKHTDLCTEAEVESEGVICGLGVSSEASGAFESPNHVAVNELSGDVYVTDSNDHRVQEFTATGAFVSMFGGEVNETKDNTPGATEAEKNLCTAASGDKCKEGVEAAGAGQFGYPVGVAVDNSSDSLKGDVYVTDQSNNRVEAFSATGAYLGQFTGIGGGAPEEFTEPDATAVGSTGDVYVADRNGDEAVDQFAPKVGVHGELEWVYLSQITSSHVLGPEGVAVDASGMVYVDNNKEELFKFSSDGVYEGEIAVGGKVRDVAVDTKTDDIYVVVQEERRGPGVVKEYEPSGTLLAEIGDGSINADNGESYHLTINSATESIYVVEGSNSGNDVDIFAPQAGEPSPGATTEVASSVVETSATISGRVSPNGTSTTYYFEYGTSPCTVSTCGTRTSEEGPLTGSIGQAVHAGLSGLTRGTTYHYWLVAKNAHGTVHGEAEEFTTAVPPPAVTTGQASDVTRTSAMLEGEVNPEGTQTEYSFTYIAASECSSGIANYGQAGCEAVETVPGSEGIIGAGTAAAPVSASLSGLSPDTVYYWDITADNGGSAVSGVARELVLSPAARTLGTGEVGETSGVVYGAVAPPGVDTTYHFEYGTTTAYGASIPDPEGHTGVASGFQDVSAELTGLQAGVTYHYRIVASTTSDTVYGEDETFTTAVPALYALAPGASTGAATGVTPSAATLTGNVNPQGSDTTYSFEYGTTVYYGAGAPLAGADAGSRTGVTAVAQMVSGLQPGTTYHYRLVASSAGGVSYGEDETFTTPSATPVAGGMPGSVTASPKSVKPPAVKPKSLTRAQKLANALKACKREPKKRQASCVKQARKRHGVKSKVKKKTTTKGRK